MNNFKYIKCFYHKLVFFFFVTIAVFNTSVNAEEKPEKSSVINQTNATSNQTNATSNQTNATSTPVAPVAPVTPVVTPETAVKPTNTEEKKYLRVNEPAKENLSLKPSDSTSTHVTPVVTPETAVKPTNTEEKKYLKVDEPAKENLSLKPSDSTSTPEKETSVSPEEKEYFTSKDSKKNMFLSRSEILDIMNKKIFVVLDKQRNKIIDLENGCIPDKQHIFCGSLQSSALVSDSKNTDAKFNLGYFVTENISMGLNIASSFPNSPKENYSKNDDIGGAVYAVFNLPFRSTSTYLKPVITFNNYHLENDKNISKDIPLKEKNIDLKSQSLNMMLKLGQNIPFAYGIDFDWYVSGGKINISQNVYEEKHRDLLMLNQKVDYQSTVANLGANINVPLIDNLKWNLGLNIMHDFNIAEPNLRFGIVNTSGVAKNLLQLAQTRGNISSGLSYKVNKNLEFSILPSINFSDLKDYHQYQSSLAVHISGRF